MSASESTASSRRAAGAGPSDPLIGIARELGLSSSSIHAVVRLLDEGATVPFIARYRKERTGGLDEVQIRRVEERVSYCRELETRRKRVIDEIRSQGKLTAELSARLSRAETKAELEDLYLPYKPKRRTKAAIAIERGLLPLAEMMWSRAPGRPERLAQAFVDSARELPDEASALAGARDVCAERLAEDAELRGGLREAYFARGVLRVAKRSGFAGKATKFDAYSSYEEPIAKVPSHRLLAIRRGEAEGVLRAGVTLDFERHRPRIESRVRARESSAWQAQLQQVVDAAIQRHLQPQLASQVRAELALRADADAIAVFAQNLRELLLAAPFGAEVVLGIDPGQRTGCKCAVVDATGRLLAHDTLYLVQGDSALARAREVLWQLCSAHAVRAVAVGNGTHGRETEAFVRGVLAAQGAGDVPCVPVSESGASVYSASDVAREEFPDLDLTVRGAISIARRLQDPLAELVKVDPKSIGVGQYQHDVSESALGKKLTEVVESCVNQVGVELNTASAQLLSRVAGIGPVVAKRIVARRNEKGPFPSRASLLEVSGIGAKTFEQAAGFLRIRGAAHPLDASAVHPERYALVERMAEDLGVPLGALIGSSELLRRLDWSRYRSDEVGEFTLEDIVAELDKPGRDPRRSFEPPKFRDDVRELTDLKVDMVLEGVVTNITAFGAFVDVGVHQDGLVHVSQLADRFVKDPHAVVKLGERITVRVLSVDLERRRVALSARQGSAEGAPARTPGPARATGQAGKLDASRWHAGGKRASLPRGSRSARRGDSPKKG